MFFKSKNKDNAVLKQFDGRQVKYVTRMIGGDSTSSQIVGKSGRIVIIDNEIKVLCGEVDIFKGDVSEVNCYQLLSGDGICITGYNKITCCDDNLTVYYSYYRK